MLDLRRIGVPSLLVAAAALSAAATTEAGVISQLPGNNYIAFEAEGNGVVANTGTAYAIKDNQTDAGASGGQAILFSCNDLTATNWAKGQASPGPCTVTYPLNFNQAGTYYLYYSWRSDAAYQQPSAVSPGGASSAASAANSVYLESAFGSSSYVTSWSNFVYSQQAYLVQPDQNSWGVPYVVAAGDVGKNLQFTIGLREAGMWIDRIAFSQNQNLIPNYAIGNGTLTPNGTLIQGDTSAFNALTNSSVPEPTALVGILTGGFLMMRRRR